MRVFDRMVQRRVAMVGLGVVAVSLFGATAPAVAAPAPSRTVLTTSTPSVGIGQTAKLKAVVKPVTGTLKPTGTVTFREGTAVLGTATLALVGTSQAAKLNITTLGLGSHPIVATYNGTADFAASTSLTVTITVGRAATVTTASSSTPTTVLGQTARLKATVKPTSGTAKPPGSVTFSEGATTLGTVTLALVGTVQTATLTVNGLSLGNHPITASYSGSTAFTASSGQVTLTVTKGSTTSTVVATSDGTGKVTMVVTVKAVLPARGVPTGTATFVVDGSVAQQQIVALNGTGKAQITATFLVGSAHTVRVTYDGDPMFSGSNTGTVGFTA